MELFAEAMKELDEVLAPLNDIAYYHCRELAPVLTVAVDEVAWLTTLAASFLLNLGMSHVTGGPAIRRAYSTSCGLLLGFYFHGRSYLWVMLLSQGAWFVAKALPRQSGSSLAIFYSFTLLMLGHLSYWLNDRKDIAFNTQSMPTFCKVHMTMCSYADAGKLGDKDNELTATEKRNASYLKELPSFSDWFHYM